MFIAQNRFELNEGFEHVFEEQRQESQLDDVPGFIFMARLRGDEARVYINHSVWESREAFEAWARSDAFKQAHAQGLPEGALAAHPQAAFYEVVYSEGSLAPATK